ncbi:hypothetical protein HYH03_013642 [Edaphochlamys debaryana]|uniref:PPIase cyclophilin-type domain-containing protein n=1 Tax=Edaphochlamys debaryana TaxID=47281 RepID=A0A836BUB7_9CHLO|nr:hypothetical protein HYH03_013642 [Edaphochlamys debaryana]|eukprot:KAG2487798.1 hypothetical protein HYH03_013642 [Edaphochlamys debaryana]
MGAVHTIESDSTTSTGASLGSTVSVNSGGASGASGAGGAIHSGASLADVCHIDEHNEYHGDVVMWGERNMKATAAECCQSCADTPGCNIWVFCPRDQGCGYTNPPRPKGECWLKNNSMAYIFDNFGQGSAGIHWTAGAVYSAEQLAAFQAERVRAAEAEAARLRALKEDPDLPLVWVEVALNGTVLGRIEYVLFAKDSPRAAENMRVLCSGEMGKDLHLKGSYYYRIIDRFIDQTGARGDGIFGGPFHDDPGGIKLKHDRKGLLSMANSGPNTNGGHFSTTMGPAHHLDGSYTIFGEVVSGLEIAEAVNKLSKGRKNNELLQSTLAQIVDAGQYRKGTYTETPQFKAVIEAEKRRVEWRRTAKNALLYRLHGLWEDQSLPLVYLDVAIKGLYAGRMEFVLFAKDSPRAAENFRLLCTGEAGVAPEGHEGAGKPYHFKGVNFYRIIENFIDQSGQWTDSPLGGLFRDDPGGLKINHTHAGLLSMANMGPNTNGAHFSIIMGPAHHLDGHYTIFGEMVDGHNVAEAINALAHGQPNNEHSGSQDAIVVDSGMLRRGTYLDSPEFTAVIAEEKRYIQEQRSKKQQGAGKR